MPQSGSMEACMKVTLQQIKEGSEEAVIKYRQMTDRIAAIVRYLEGQGEKLLAQKDGQQLVISVPEILYLESVDGTVFLYTEKDICRLALSLTMFESIYAQEGFFRCGKSTILNIYRIKRLKSMSGNRIDATMDNDEHIIISRRYAKELRNILKGEEE